ncbi:MAG: hypothetical protein ACETWT_05700 [Thermodesulfobacteriota bacterium]
MNYKNRPNVVGTWKESRQGGKSLILNSHIDTVIIGLGKLTDFEVLSENPCKVDLWEIRNIKVERTIIGGESVFQAE